MRIVSIIILLAFFFSSSASPALAAMTYLYDQNGNMTSDGTKCYEYNEANQLRKVKKCSNNQTIAEYVYDYNGKRLVKKEYENGTLKRTVYSPDDESETVKKPDGTTENTTYYKANDEVIAKKNPDGSLQYYHNDHLGSNSVLTNQSGSVVEKTTYEPFGEVKSGGTKSKFGYTGQEKDLETGLNYYDARYYDSHTHHFTQADDIIQDWYDPQSLNRYSYVRNNPLKYTDPTGHYWIPAIIIGLGAYFSAVEAMENYSADKPSATGQERFVVGLGAAATGGVATGVTILRASSLPAVATVGGLSSGAQQVWSNAVAGKPFGAGIEQAMVTGAAYSVTAGLIVKGAKLAPNPVGRPVQLTKDRKLSESFSKNSLHAISKSSFPDLLSSHLKMVTASIITNLFGNNAKSPTTKKSETKSTNTKNKQLKKR